MEKLTKHSFFSVFTLPMALVCLMVSSLSLSGCGGGGDSSSTIETENIVPIASDFSYTLDDYTSFTADLSVNDIEGGSVWSLLSEPTYGRVIVESDGQFQYTPDLGYIGEDSFSYLLTDIDGSSVSGLVRLLILPIISINDALFSEQWYLKNVAQVTITGIGTTGADIWVGDGAGAGADAGEYAQGFTGNGVEIAIIDTGLEIDHADLAPNVVLNGSYNFSYPDNEKEQFDPTATDADGDHGTGVAGLVGARGGNIIGIWGVAPSAELKGFNFLVTEGINEELASLGYKASADNFPGLTSTEVDIFNRSYGRNIVTVPFTIGGESTYDEILIDAMEWGTKNLRSTKGAIYVKAGGNAFKGEEICVEYRDGECIKYADCALANENNITCYNVNMETENASPFQMVIGAFNADDKRASYSNTGSALWLSAPGGERLGIMTTDQSGCDKGYNQATQSYDTNCDYVATFVGTSAAVPIVSGAAALLLEANPDLSWRDVKHILATTARQLELDLSSKTLLVDDASVPVTVTLEAGWVTNDAGYSYSNAYGFGALSVDAAITMAREWKTSNTTLRPLQTLLKGPFTLSADNVITDNNAVGLSTITTVTVAENLVAESVALTLSIEATAGTEIDISDYQIILESPGGTAGRTQSILLTPFNAYKAGSNMTDLTLISHAFYGEAITGDWKLIIRDLDEGGTGKLTQWSLNFYGH